MRAHLTKEKLIIFIVAAEILMEGVSEPLLPGQRRSPHA
jgi:hypothetical protein